MLIKPLHSRQKSAISNGKRLFIDGDGRSPWARRRKDIALGLMEDLGKTTEAQRALVWRAASLLTELEGLEGRLSKGESVALDMYTRMQGQVVRTLKALGVATKLNEDVEENPDERFDMSKLNFARVVTPQALKAKAAAAEADESEEVEP